MILQFLSDKQIFFDNFSIFSERWDTIADFIDHIAEHDDS